MADNKNISKRSGLSRDDIRNYSGSTDERLKHDIEMRSNDSAFEQDAFDGWEEIGYDLTAMKRLDKKFIRSSYSLFNVGLVLITVISISAALYFWKTGKDNDVLKVSETPGFQSTMENGELLITIDEEDVILDTEIEKMTEAIEPEQIKVKSIQSVQKSIDSFQLANTDVDTVRHLNPLPTEPLDKPAVPELLKGKASGKEIYLNDLKLVDYRAYRSKPEIKTKQLVLTGTSADKENSGSEGQTSEWKDVEIPYIEYIDKTTRLMDRNSFKKVLDRCETILKTYPDDINALFYGGICLYNLKEYGKAIDYFSKVRSNDFSNFDEEALWLIANSLDKSGQKEKARTKYSEIVKEGGYYAKQAQERLKK